MKNVRSLEIDLWRTEKIADGGEAGLNAPDDYITNIGGRRSEQTPYIKLAANRDSSFAVSNSRNNFTQNYPPRK
jgi:hypothetical protein